MDTAKNKRPIKISTKYRVSIEKYELWNADMKTVSNISILLFVILAGATVFLFNKGIEHFFLLPLVAIVFFVIAIITSGEKFKLTRAEIDIEMEMVIRQKNEKYSLKQRTMSFLVYASCMVASAVAFHVVSHSYQIQLMNDFVIIFFAYLISQSITQTLLLKRLPEIIIFLILAGATVTILATTSYGNLAGLGDYGILGLILVLAAHYGSKLTAKCITSVTPTIY